MKFISIAIGQQENSYDLHALADDGSVWILTYRTQGFGWYRVSPSVKGEPEFVPAPKS